MKSNIEHIKFTRGGNPLKSLNIGKRVEIVNWFKTWAPYADYEIDDDLNIRIKGSLNLYETKVIFLPDNLHIEGYLDLYRTKIVYLPDNLHVEGSLNITGTYTTSLPDNLHVEEFLYMENTKITSLPDDLYVGKKIYKDFK